VSAAIAELLRRGQKPALRNVKDIAGGCYRDLGPLIKELLPKVEDELRAERAIPAPPEAVQSGFLALWFAAWHEATARFDEERRKLAAKIAAKQAEAEEAWATVQAVDAEREAAPIPLSAWRRNAGSAPSG
jgi:hypothetical protein